MSDIKLFRLTQGQATELQGAASGLEKHLQTLIENNLDPLLGIRFLATEYFTGKNHNGRIDSLGLDENNCPVILEYKRSTSENVINQGLFYLDWLLDHKAEFARLVEDKLNRQTADEIDWSAPRLICIASDFTRYDAQARIGDKTYAECLLDLPADLRELLSSLEDYLLTLGDDVQRKQLKLYVAFKRLKNFASIVLQRNRILLYLHLAPESISLVPGKMRNMRNAGHWGTGDLEISMTGPLDLDMVKNLIQMAYEGRQLPTTAANGTEPGLVQ